MIDFAKTRDLSLAVTGSGGAGAISAGELILQLAGKHHCFGMMRRSFGPQIRGGEAASLIRISREPVECMNDRFDLLLALDWRNADRFAEEIALRGSGLILADPKAGEIPPVFADTGTKCLELPLSELAGEIPGGRANMVAFGVIAGWLGFCPKTAASLIQDFFSGKSEEILAGSVAAFDKGYAASQSLPGAAERPVEPPAEADDKGQRWHISGNEGCGLGALRGGIRFAAAYPITPASDLLEWLSPRLEQLGGSMVQAEDELASVNMVIGASFGGVPAMTATSGPGLALMTEAMGLAVASEIPALVVDVMRGGPSTGVPTKSEQSDLNMALYGLHGDAPHLVLGALDHADCILTTEWAVRLAEALQTVAVVLSDQNLAQSRALIPKPEYSLPDIPPRKPVADPETYQRYQLADDGISPMSIPGAAELMYVADGLEHEESGKPSTAAAVHRAQLDKRQRKIDSFGYGELWAKCYGQGETAILTWGSTSAAVREARDRLEATGVSVRVIALRLLLPARPHRMAAALKGVERILVVEQSHSGQFHRYLKAWYDTEAEVRLLARPGPLPIGPGEIVDEIESWR